MLGMPQTSFLSEKLLTRHVKSSFPFFIGLGCAAIVSMMQVLELTGASPAATAMFEDSLRNLRQVL